MNLFRFYNQNRILFWMIIIAIVVFYIIIHIMNSIVASNDKNKNVVIDERLYENKISIEEQILNEQVEEEPDLIIDQFIRYCNTNNTQDAYELLTVECREELFPTFSVFEKNYIRVNFNTQKLYSKEIYSGSTYKIRLYENMLSTGNTNNETNIDYYTIVKQDGKTKLNISNYIKQNEINKVTQYNEIKVENLKKDSYMEYEIYTLKITNLTNDIIILDTKTNTKTMYLLDENNVRYYATGHEILDDNLIIRPKATNIIKIKYIKDYKSNTSKKLVFEDIILNYVENTDINKYEKIRMDVNI